MAVHVKGESTRGKGDPNAFERDPQLLHGRKEFNRRGAGEQSIPCGGIQEERQGTNGERCRKDIEQALGLRGFLGIDQLGEREQIGHGGGMIEFTSHHLPIEVTGSGVLDPGRSQALFDLDQDGPGSLFDSQPETPRWALPILEFGLEGDR